MPRGRPKGSKNKEIKITKADITTTKEIEEIREKTYKSSYFCDLCGKEIYCSPNAINLSILTSKAFWHRNCKKDRLNVCNDCAKEISDILDNFIINKNSSLMKFS